MAPPSKQQDQPKKSSTSRMAKSGSNLGKTVGKGAGGLIGGLVAGLIGGVIDIVKGVINLIKGNKKSQDSAPDQGLHPAQWQQQSNYPSSAHSHQLTLEIHIPSKIKTQAKEVGGAIKAHQKGLSSEQKSPQTIPNKASLTPSPLHPANKQVLLKASRALVKYQPI